MAEYNPDHNKRYGYEIAGVIWAPVTLGTTHSKTTHSSSSVVHIRAAGECAHKTRPDPTVRVCSVLTPQ